MRPKMRREYNWGNQLEGWSHEQIRDWAVDRARTCEIAQLITGCMWAGLRARAYRDVERIQQAKCRRAA